MNILRALGFGAKPQPKSAPKFSYELPEVNAFVEVGLEGAGPRQSVSIDAADAAGLITRGVVAGLKAGASADFLYTNGFGKFRFTTTCAKVDAGQTFFDFPTSIKTIQWFGNRRASARVPLIIPVQWRYAPDAQGYGEFLDASLMDISIGGAALVVGRELKTGAQVEVRFTLKSKRSPLVGLCQVVRAEKIEISDKSAAGIRFLDVGREDEQILSEFVSAEQTQRRKRGII